LIIEVMYKNYGVINEFFIYGYDNLMLTCIPK
jgi:hypothetical protein